MRIEEMMREREVSEDQELFSPSRVDRVAEVFEPREKTI